MWSADSEEDSPVRHTRPVLQIRAQCTADVVRNWKLCALPPFAVNGELAALPVKVIECQPADLALAQTETRQKDEDGEVALADQSPTIATREHASYFRRREPSRERAITPSDRRWHGLR